MAENVKPQPAQAGNRAASGTTQTAPKNNDEFDFAAEAKVVSAENGFTMLPGDPGEPVGPEDALGEGPKRGDYSTTMRLESPHEAVLTGETTDAGVPIRELVPQAPRVEEVGDVKGKKGGVETAPEKS